MLINPLLPSVPSGARVAKVVFILVYEGSIKKRLMSVATMSR